MKSALFSNFLIILTIFSQVAWAGSPDENQFVKYPDLEYLATQAMTAEAKVVSDELKKGNSDIAGYKKNKKALKFLLGQMNKTKINPNFLFNKCIMDSKTIAAILSHTLSDANDGVTTRIQALSLMRQTYTTQMWRLTSQMCKNSQIRFTKALTENGVGEVRHLDSVAIKNLSALVFFPTQFGKPGFKNVSEGRLAAALTAAIIVGSTASMFAAPFAGVVISLAVISSSSIGLKNSLPHAENKLRNLEFTNISPVDEN